MSLLKKGSASSVRVKARANYTKLTFFLTSHATVNIRQRVETMSRKERKDALAHTVVSKRLLNSQCSYFVFKRECLLCGNVCKMKNSKNPHRWVKVRQYKTVNRGSSISSITVGEPP